MSDERLLKFRKLQEEREKSLSLNLAAVKEEEAKKRLHPKEKERLDRKRKRAEELQERLENKEKGEDYERKSLLKFSAEQVEEWEKKQKIKAAKKDVGFSDFNQMSWRKYEKLVGAINPDVEQYMESKTKMGKEELYRNADSLAYNSSDKPSDVVLDRLVEDLNKRAEKGAKFSKRKVYNEDADVTSINTRNEKFNRKIARAFDKHTAEIRESFERGTAL